MTVKCKKCGKQVGYAKKGVNCVGCGDTYHVLCGKISEALLAEIEQGTSDWRCSATTCKRKSIINVGSTRHDSVSSVDPAYEDPDFASTLNDLSTGIRALAEAHKQSMKSITEMSVKMEKLQSLSNTVAKHEHRLKALEGENKNLKTLVKSLSIRLDNHEQHLHNNKLQINNIPRSDNEDLSDIVCKIGNQLGILMNNDQILDVYRPNPTPIKSTHRESADGSSSSTNHENAGPSNSSENNSGMKYNTPIIIQFRSNKLRNDILGKFRANREIYFDIEKKTKIYIIEFLSFNRRRQLHRAKLFCKENDYKYVWTKGGNVYIKRDNGAKTVRITDSTDFAGIAGVDSGATGRER